MTPFTQLSPLSYELHPWELETRQNTLAGLDDRVREESTKFKAAQKEFEEELGRIQLRHRKMHDIFPMILQYVKGLHNEFKKYGDRAEASGAKMKDGIEERKYLQNEFVCLRKLDYKTQSRLNSFVHFKKFLESVCDASNGSVKTIPDLLESFAYGGRIREVMFKRIQDAESKRREREEYLRQYLLGSDTEVLKLHSLARELKQRQDVLAMQHTDLNEQLNTVKANASKQVVTAGSLKIAIHNLYVEVCQKLRIPIKIESSDSVGQLIFLETAFKDLKRLVERTREALRIPDTDDIIN